MHAYNLASLFKRTYTGNLLWGHSRGVLSLPRACAVLTCALWLAPPLPGSAQDSADAGLEAPARAEPEDLEPSAPEAERIPPRVLELGVVYFPPSLTLPEDGAVEVTLIVGRDGRAQLEECREPAQVCDAVSAALLVSSFEPARVNGEARAARVQARFSVRPAPEPVATYERAPQPAAEAPEVAPPPPAETESAGEYGAEARVERPTPTAHALSLEEMRELPGALGDPFRAIEALPGVVPVMTGLPYVYVRGAPPAATAYFYDEIQLPALFHLALGPAVVHPAMVGPIDFYPGVAPARYGRKTGGVVTGKAALRPLKPGVHGEVELRLVDVQAYVATPLENGGRVEVAGRYGYPGLAIKLFESSAVLQYWDYQLRTILPLSNHTEATVIALGSFDLVGERRDGRLRRQLELQFHRLEARLTRRKAGTLLGFALSGGFERSGLADEVHVRASRFGPKLWLDARVRKASLRFGADMLASIGKLMAGTTDDPSDFPLSSHPAYRSANGRKPSAPTPSCCGPSCRGSSSRRGCVRTCGSQGATRSTRSSRGPSCASTRTSGSRCTARSAWPTNRRSS